MHTTEFCCTCNGVGGFRFAEEALLTDVALGAKETLPALLARLPPLVCDWDSAAFAELVVLLAVVVEEPVDMSPAG